MQICPGINLLPPAVNLISCHNTATARKKGIHSECITPTPCEKNQYKATHQCIPAVLFIDLHYCGGLWRQFILNSVGGILKRDHTNASCCFYFRLELFNSFIAMYENDLNFKVLEFNPHLWRFIFWAVLSCSASSLWCGRWFYPGARLWKK